MNHCCQRSRCSCSRRLLGTGIVSVSVEVIFLSVLLSALNSVPQQPPRVRGSINLNDTEILAVTSTISFHSLQFKYKPLDCTDVCVTAKVAHSRRLLSYLGIFPPHPLSPQSQKHACNMQTDNKKQNKWNNSPAEVRCQHRPPLLGSKRPSKCGQVKTWCPSRCH
jgi:hypothetical protein